MASAGAIEAGGAFVRVFVDDAAANRSLAALQTRVKRFADEVASVGKGLALTGAGLGAAHDIGLAHLDGNSRIIFIEGGLRKINSLDSVECTREQPEGKRCSAGRHRGFVAFDCPCGRD